MDIPTQQQNTQPNDFSNTQGVKQQFIERFKNNPKLLVLLSISIASMLFAISVLFVVFLRDKPFATNTQSDSEAIAKLASYNLPKQFLDVSEESTISVIKSDDYIPGKLSSETKAGLKIVIFRNLKSSPSDCPTLRPGGNPNAKQTTIAGLPGFVENVDFEGHEVRYCVDRDNYTWDIRFFFSETDTQKYQEQINAFLESFNFI